MTVRELAEWTGGTLRSGSDGAMISRVWHDSRTMRPGDLYVALRGARLDGHDYAGRAVQAGAVALLVSRDVGEVPSRVVVVRVEETLLALHRISRAVRALFTGPMVAITGSNGKTTTKEMLARIVTRRVGAARVCVSPGNWNNQVGLPLTLCGITRAHQVGIVELGMNGPGEIALLAGLARPDLGVITNSGRAHLGRLGSREAILAAKWELVERLPQNGIAVLNADDEVLMSARPRAACRVTTFGISHLADVSAENLELGAGGTSFILKSGERRAPVRLAAPGGFQVSNALAAAAAAIGLGLTVEEIAAGLDGAGAPRRRMEIVDAGGVTVVDDAYNANPDSMLAAIGEAARLYPDRRRILVVGDMLELGGFAAEEHRRIGSEAAASGAWGVVAIGGQAGAVVEGAVSAGLPPERAAAFAEKTEAGAALLGWLKEGDVVLVKGSRGMALEEVVTRVVSARVSAA